ncbi:UDP-glucose 4-epimerase GalE [Neobacillus sp. PS3-40]|uniref:UDP-glucose 4-epimerase GalE n=1 Tax=Neobacillus sp. PS3-40 TaxID=3070679 RepID=UPI0027E09FB4|nr:UDP-glucose 4-epimerase GalE [Neobacillus sp. PS3-40]WML45822.1 UDP-glucose 4-epimerase GalE [Neobacillus sp. PS3-40]
MAILVTGGAGYIGSHTVVELLTAGYEVIVLDNFSNSSPMSLKRVSEITGREFKIYNVSILDRNGLEKVFSENSIHAVIHFAGFKAVGESVEAPLKYYQNNISGTILLCEMMQKYEVKRLVFSSSATVYGVPKVVPISEDSPLSATNPYGRTKLMIEEILEDLFRSDNRWSISILRYFNPIGAHDSGKIGEDPSGIPNNLVPYITKVAVGKLRELKIFGADYPTKDGTGVRDYIHVVDLAMGHLKALEKNFASTGVSTYNLGTGKGYSVLEIVKTFEKMCGEKIPYTITERRPGDVAVCFSDPSKAKKELNWSAKKEIEEMCADSWRWQAKNQEGYDEEENTILAGTGNLRLIQNNGDFLY